MKGSKSGVIQFTRIDTIINLYQKHIEELKLVRRLLKDFYTHSLGETAAYLDDIEGEITYLLVRHTQPKVIVEISPHCGWSTFWILSAIKQNKKGNLYSYDIIDDSERLIPTELQKGRRRFFKGDVREKLKLIPKNIDYLFMDSDHSAGFCRWYIRNIFPKLSNNAIISVHDIFHYSDEPWQFEESRIISDWLKKMKVNFLTVSPSTPLGKGNYMVIQKMRRKLGINEDLTSHKCNPMVFFKIEKGKVRNTI